MAPYPMRPPNPICFLQAFIAQGLKVVGRLYGAGEGGTDRYIEQVGLAASHSLEQGARTSLGYEGAITPDQYADVIIALKNQIGGNFSRASAPPGVIRVENTRCPFGDRVREAPELCRMTASVFGGIAARNFGYGKVELKKRIAVGEERCEVLIYTSRQAAQGRPGDEYQFEGDNIVSRSASAEVRARVEARLHSVWCAVPEIPARRPRALAMAVAESGAMRSVLQVAEIVAPTSATVLVTGETGVGKEVVARAIHAMSERADKTFLAVNCGSIPESLIESALFGHEKGAFTGAFNVHTGFFGRADRGTLLLDEIDSLPISAQVRLLRVLQEGEFERVGGRQTLRVDARIIALSNQNLEQAVREGRFRRDLYYRLNVVPIRIPPLRERPDDIPPLVAHLLNRLAEKYRTPARSLGHWAWSQIGGHSWPGNVRELENVLERSFLLARGAVIDALEIDSESGSSVPQSTSTTSLHDLRRRVTREVESRALVEALGRCDGNVSATARNMGITPRGLHMRLKRLGLTAATFRTRG